MFAQPPARAIEVPGRLKMGNFQRKQWAWRHIMCSTRYIGQRTPDGQNHVVPTHIPSHSYTMQVITAGSQAAPRMILLPDVVNRGHTTAHISVSNVNCGSQ